MSGTLLGGYAEAEVRRLSLERVEHDPAVRMAIEREQVATTGRMNRLRGYASRLTHSAAIGTSAGVAPAAAAKAASGANAGFVSPGTSPAVQAGGRGGVIQFTLPPELEAPGPPERRGLRRDHVRLMVLPRRGGVVSHTTFERIGDYLRPGDLLVFNDSRTLPALMPGETPEGEKIEVRLARQVGPDAWEALLLPHGGRHEGKQIRFRAGLSAVVGEPRTDAPWLWRLRFDVSGDELLDRIYRAGEPIRYTYVRDVLPVDDYQTIYAAEPGSVEMPSAGRPFSWEVLLGLRRKGVETAFITLHTGLSSFRNDEFDALHVAHEERFRVSKEAARAVNRTRAAGGRVIAVGTTVVRTLETLASADGRVHADEGVTSLYISAAHKLRAVDGLLTGLHEPLATHLDMLSAFVSPSLLAPAYEEALHRGYLWHEFGDVNLIA